MNFWKYLHLIGSVIVLVIAVLTVVLALLHRPDTDDDTPSPRSPPAFKPQVGPTGL